MQYPVERLPADRRRVLILLNPTAGAGPRRRRLLRFVEALRRQHLEPQLVADRNRLDALARDCDARGRLRCVVAAGGDGTVADVVNRLAHVPVALLPLGTENLLARHLGITSSARAAADAVAGGRVITLDAGRITWPEHASPPYQGGAGGGGEHGSPPYQRGGGRRSSRLFLLMATAGFDAYVVHHVHQARRGHIRRWSYACPIARALREYAYPELRIWCDDAKQPIAARLAFFFNLPCYARDMKIAARASGDDGLLDARLFQRGSFWSMFRYAMGVARRTHERLPDVRSLQARRIRMECDVPACIQLDGDPGGFTPATLEVLPRYWRVLVPDSGST